MLGDVVDEVHATAQLVRDGQNHIDSWKRAADAFSTALRFQAEHQSDPDIWIGTTETLITPS
jgi:hypothetical protein